MCATSYAELDPRLFSYNSKHGWCPDCVGTGLELTREQRKALDDSQQDDNKGREQTFAEPDVEDVEDVECGTCHGARLNAVARAVQLRGEDQINLINLATGCYSPLTGFMTEQEYARNKQLLQKEGRI